ncbi:MAG: hypothetical protein FJZ57_02670, partial [Chlamydiae bacterium]|nr:hypothetical protein [Chlamydiota bacterium]
MASTFHTHSISGLGRCTANLTGLFPGNDFTKGMENLNALANLYSDLSRFKYSEDNPDSIYLTERMNSIENQDICNNIYRLTWILMGKPTFEHEDEHQRMIAHLDFGQMSFLNIKDITNANRDSPVDLKLLAIRYQAAEIVSKKLLPSIMSKGSELKRNQTYRESIHILNDCFKTMDLPICLPQHMKSILEEIELQQSVQDLFEKLDSSFTEKSNALVEESLSIEEHIETIDESLVSPSRGIYVKNLSSTAYLNNFTIPDAPKFIDEHKRTLEEVKQSLISQTPSLERPLNQLMLFTELNNLVLLNEQATIENKHTSLQDITSKVEQLAESNRNRMFEGLWIARGRPLADPEFGRKAFFAKDSEKRHSESKFKYEAVAFACKKIIETEILPFLDDPRKINPFIDTLNLAGQISYNGINIPDYKQDGLTTTRLRSTQKSSIDLQETPDASDHAETLIDLKKIEQAIVGENRSLEEPMRHIMIFSRINELVTLYDQAEVSDRHKIFHEIKSQVELIPEELQNKIFEKLWIARGRIVEGPLAHPQFGQIAFFASKSNPHYTESRYKREAISLVCKELIESQILPNLQNKKA